MTAEGFTTGEWITVELDGCRARCHLVPNNGRATINAIEISSLEADGEIHVAGLRQLTRKRILAEIEPIGAHLDATQRNAAVYGRRQQEDLLALVAISFEEFAAAGSPHPARDVYDFLIELHEVESADDWPWPEKEIGRMYTRSSVRTLIARAKKRGYWLGDAAHPSLLEGGATATLRLADEQKDRYFSDP